MIPAKLARALPLLPWLVSLALAGCGQEGKPNAPRSDTGIELFAPPRKSLYVEPGTTLAALLERYTERMGWSLLVSENLRETLAARHVGFAQRLEVPFGSVHGFVEALVRSNGFLLRFEHTSDPVVLQVLDPDEQRGGDIPAHRVLVPLAEVPLWEAHPAHMISAQAPLPAGDPQALVTSLRAVFGETARGVVQQAGETNTLLLSGTGAEVARLVRVLGELSGKPAALPPPIERTRWIELLRTPQEGLHVEQTDGSQLGLPLRTLVEQYAQRMGWQLLAGADVRAQLESERLGTHLPLDVPAANVHSFVEGVLRANNFLLEFAHASDPVLLRVTVAEGRGERLRANAMEVEADELPRWVAHTDFLIRTKLNLPGVDARALANGLRPLFNDEQRQQILPIGTDGMIVTGYASEVARIAQLFRALVDEAAGAKPVTPPAVPATTDLACLANPTEALHLARPERDEARLLDLVDAYAQHMGWEVLVAGDVRNALRQLKCGIALPVDVPAERVHAFVQGILKANDFVLSFASTQEPVLLHVQGTNSPGRGNARKSACFVRPEEIARWSAHPDFLVTTVVDLPGVDVRTLSNSLRQMFSDQQTQQIIPLGNSDSLLVTGFADEVSHLLKLFHTLVDSAAGKRGELPAVMPAARVLDLFTLPAKPLHLENAGKNELRLQGLVDAYAQLMGWRVLVSLESAGQLKQLRCGFALPVDVPPENVHAFVEGVLRANDFVIGFAHTQEPVLLTLSSTNAPGKGNPRRDSLFVPVSDLPRWSAHPDFLVTTLADLPGVDVRTLSNSLRQMFSDQQTQQIIPVGDTNGLIVTGFASDVADILNSFRTLVEAAAGTHASLPSLPRMDSGIELLVPPAKGLHFEKRADEELQLGQIFTQYAEALGWRILSNPNFDSELRRRCTIPLPLDVPAENVHTFVEGIARANGFFFGFAHTKPPVLLRLESTDSPRRSMLREDATFVQPGELARWASHPAFVISTCIDLPGIDVRTISNSLRQMFSDAQTQQILPMGNSDGLVVVGFAPDVVGIVGSLAELSSGGIGLKPAATLAPPAVDRARLFPLGGTDFILEAFAGKEPEPLEVLEAFAKWTQRPLEIGKEARAALEHAERRFAEPQTVRPELAYPYVGLLLERAGCTLSPVPPAAPVKWVVDIERVVKKEPLPPDLPTIPFEQLSAWSGYCATPFRTYLNLPESADRERIDDVLRLIVIPRAGCQVQVTGAQVILIAGTPQRIQAAASAILQACEPLPAGGR